MSEWLGSLLEMTERIYQDVHRLFGSKISRKVVGHGAGGDITRYIDAIAEEAAKKYVKKKKINCVLVCEEGGVEKIGEKPEVYLVIDAIDGTTNATRGIRFVSASIAASKVNRLSGVEAAAVMNLYDGGVYTAEKGGGAKYNGEKISPSNVEDLSIAVVSVDLSKSPETVNKVVPVLKKSGAIRSLGSAALEICHVSSGRLDAYIDVREKLRTTDIAAATLIIKEAGGILLQPDGKPLKDSSLTKIERFSLIAAANAGIFRQIKALIQEV
ncbi:TPA: hypothetical protein EYP70_05850 [Candidatus Bathyarchaeota archaeon]|nr:hypothetical protein [Candidatus Bathyarchaeota archaeon]